MNKIPNNVVKKFTSDVFRLINKMNTLGKKSVN